MTSSNLPANSNKELLQSIRSKANAILNSLEIDIDNGIDIDIDAGQTQAGTNDSDTTQVYYESWIHGKVQVQQLGEEHKGKDKYPTTKCQYFDENGFLLMPSFCDNREINSMKDEMKKLVKEQWHPNHDIGGDGDVDSDSDSDSSTKCRNEGDEGINEDEQRNTITQNPKPVKGKKESQKKGISVFRTDEKQVEFQGSDDYFLSSANKIHFFAESKAIDKEKNSLKSKYISGNNNDNKMLALNKAGHGMHMVKGNSFYSYTTSEKIYNIVHELGWRDPVVPQSMYIFKQAYVGAEVTSHQDSTFLYTTPKQSCLGLWLALDDATLMNGCLWVRPKSHKEKVRRIFQRNVEYFGEDSIRCRSNIAKGDFTKSQMIFTNEVASTPIPWDGKIPGGISTSESNNDYDKEDEEDEEHQKISSLPWDSLFDAGFVPIECKAGDLLVFPGELDHLSLPNYSEHQRHTFQLHLVEGEGAGVKWSEMNWLQYPVGIPFLSLNKSRADP